MHATLDNVVHRQTIPPYTGCTSPNRYIIDRLWIIVTLVPYLQPPKRVSVDHS